MKPTHPSRPCALLLAAALACCDHPERPRGGAPPSVPAPGSAVGQSDGSGLADTSDGSTDELGWAAAIRRDDWKDAANLIDALPVDDRSKPKLKYARARVALALGDAERVLSSLASLEQDLPLLAADIQRTRAEAQSLIGPYAAAAAYFSAKGTPMAALKAASAFERAGDDAKAREQCERVLAIERRTRQQEAAARALRSRVAEREGDEATAATDARWIAIHAPDGPAAREADLTIARLQPRQPLAGVELLARARVLADAGQTDDALRALDKIAAAPAPKVSHLDELHARADLLYKTRGRALEAARVFDECAASSGSHALEDDFRAGRALARADHDEEAIARMTRIARLHPKSVWGDEAQYFGAYLRLLHGEWKTAAEGFEAYARNYPRGVERREAMRNRGIASFMNDDFGTARQLLEQFAKDEPDPIEAARAESLAALSALRDGQRLNAIARWTEIVHSVPLSFPSIVARSRLADAGAAVPAALENIVAPTVAGEPLTVSLPPPVEALHEIGLDRDAEAALEERESIVGSRAPPGRALEALCAAYGMLGRGKRRFQLSRQIKPQLLAAAPNPATRWAWECAYPEPYDGSVKEGPADRELTSLVYGVMRQESSFDPDAVSPAGAVGLMQLLPATARATAASASIRFDDASLARVGTNVTLGVRYLSDLRARFHALPLAVAAYNAGEDGVDRWLDRTRGVDLDVFSELIPFPETRVYVARVMGNFARYEYLRMGEPGVPTIALQLKR